VVALRPRAAVRADGVARAGLLAQAAQTPPRRLAASAQGRRVLGSRRADQERQGTPRAAALLGGGTRPRGRLRGSAARAQEATLDHQARTQDPQYVDAQRPL